MCRNIHVLSNLEPAATDEEVRAASLQYVRKIAGAARPSRRNEQAYDQALDAVAAATRRLLDELVTDAPPRDREVEAAKARARSELRFPREASRPPAAAPAR